MDQDNLISVLDLAKKLLAFVPEGDSIAVGLQKHIDDTFLELPEHRRMELNKIVRLIQERWPNVTGYDDLEHQWEKDFIGCWNEQMASERRK